jgi:ATP phosphoribosyltransferase
MADDKWVAVRSLVPRKQHQNLMDELSELGAKAILASDIRSCRF